jgi:hypothetical protein
MAALPPLFADTEMALVPAHTIAEFPPPTFLESIVIAVHPDEGKLLYISSLEEGKIYRVELAGKCTVHAQIAGKAAGLAALPEQALLLSGWNAAGIPCLWVIDAAGILTTCLELPDAQFLNGITHLKDQTYLVADSYRGAIWAFDYAQSQASIWLEHPLLARSEATAVFPAVNGLKIFNQDLYATNTQQQLLLKIPLQNSHQPGVPEPVRRQVNLDDFAFDAAGNLYGTTHVFNSVVKLTPTGEMTVIATAAEGMVGSTALAVDQETQAAYVVTNGGLSFPPPTGLETAKVVRLTII